MEDIEPIKVQFRKSALTSESAKLFDLPESAQDNDNLYSMGNWAPIYMPLLDRIGPRVIVEIGSEYGGNTRHLGRYCLARGIELHIVDTHPREDPEIHAKPLIHYHEARSVDFLPGFKGAQVYFIDGDHNYRTVRAELELIAGAYDGHGPLLLLLHDTGWPCGCVDTFYDPSTVDGELEPFSSNKGPLPWKDELDENGFGSGFVSYSNRIGGPANGVRPAIEDFVEARSGWSTAYFTPFYGLCLLWKEDSLSDDQRDYIRELVGALDRMGPILATLEWNRVLLYLQTQFMRVEWERQQAIFTESWSKQQETISDLMTKNKLLGEEWRKQQEIIADLIAENKRAGETWREQQDWILQLEKRLRDAGIEF